jgi:hypothetical protein
MDENRESINIDRLVLVRSSTEVTSRNGTKTRLCG